MSEVRARLSREEEAFLACFVVGYSVIHGSSASPPLFKALIQQVFQGIEFSREEREMSPLQYEAWKRRNHLQVGERVYRSVGPATEARFRKFAEEAGWTVSKRGWPDFILNRGGETVFVEVKSKQTTGVSRPQSAIMGLLARAGFKVFRWDPQKGFTRVCGDTALPLAEGLPKNEEPNHARRERLRRRKEAAEFDAASVPVPPELDAPDFRLAWEQRLKVLATMGQKGKLTEPQVLAKFRKMIRLKDACGLEAVVLCIERATEGRHQGEIFPDDFHRLRPRNGGQAAKPAPGSTSAQLQRAQAIDEQEAPSIWGQP